MARKPNVLGLVAIFIALSGTAIAGSNLATTSAVTNKKFKKLKRQVAGLRTALNKRRWAIRRSPTTR